jgi:hypothetical protein
MNRFTIKPYGRFWAVFEGTQTLVCVCVYKRGAQAVVHRLLWRPGTN